MDCTPNRPCCDLCALEAQQLHSSTVHPIYPSHLLQPSRSSVPPGNFRSSGGQARFVSSIPPPSKAKDPVPVSGRLWHHTLPATLFGSPDYPTPLSRIDSTPMPRMVGSYRSSSHGTLSRHRIRSTTLHRLDPSAVVVVPWRSAWHSRIHQDGTYASVALDHCDPLQCPGPGVYTVIGFPWFPYTGTLDG